MALTDATYCRVTGHLADGFYVMRQQQHPRTHACRRKGSLSTGMTGTDDDDIKGFWVLHNWRFSKKEPVIIHPAI
ncbi:hypothetical protein BMS3Bbin11_00421 [bacterium BMS3Bbin11]|nr:hypothetical protein BMS3Bbin11_00421 [bacterium BMS3Bbin11]